VYPNHLRKKSAKPVINYRIEYEGDILHVIARGRDENLQEVTGYGMAIIEAANLHQTKKVLCDERELEYAISVFDTFELAEAASKFAPRVAHIAIICHPRHLEIGKFYETVAHNRGLQILVTSDFDEAVKWLG
jgi:hypothetical protein